jgi:predicted alpha/beta-fold hydrolase
MFYIVLASLQGDFMHNVDISLVTREWIQIPNHTSTFSTVNETNVLHALIYKPKIESKKDLNFTKKPYVILGHGMGGSLFDLELMAIPLALNGFRAISFNQAGHGWGIHKSPGNGKDYTQVMVNVHDVVDYILKCDDLAYDEQGKPRIAFIGASTGGLMALTQAYLNPKIKVTVAMSGIHDFRELLARKNEYSKFSYSYFFLTMLKLMKVKIDYTEAENKIISPKQCLSMSPENKNRVFMVHCQDDPLPFSEALKNKELAGIPDENCLFLAKGGHGFRAQETIVTATVIRWLLEHL